LEAHLTLWLIGDGKLGHENQSLGLAEALRRQQPCDIHRISLAGIHGPIRRTKAALAASENFPKPDIIIAAGHATHLALLWLARKHDARSIVLMRPSLPLSLFDLCIAPSHDFPNGSHSQNLILTRGALNRVVPSTGEKSGKLILIGGPSKTHGWDTTALLEMLAKATDRGGWELTDSRRTPENFRQAVKATLPGVTIFPHYETAPEWLPGKLTQAKEVWVTEDSISMIYEALSSGAKVGLLPVPRLAKTSRVLAGIEQLTTTGYITPFSTWETSHRLTPPPEEFREADRCARLVVEKVPV
jgi:uncharacterized protein